MLCVGLIWSLAPPAWAEGIGIRLAEIPRDRQDDPRAQVWIIDHLESGQVIERDLVVINDTPEPQRIELFPGNAVIEDGNFGPLEGPSEYTEPPATWMTVTPQSAVVPPRETVAASVRIEVPDDVVAGEYYGVIWAAATSEGQVTLVNRIGVRAYLSVAGEGEPEPPSDFTIDSLIAQRHEDGHPQVSAIVTNTGERALDITGELTLTDGPAGLSAGPFATDRGPTLAPGDSAPLIVDLDPQLPSGPWLARMIVRSGEFERAAEATIVFPDAAGESAEPVEATEVPLFRDRSFLLPLAIVLVSLLVIGLALFWWFSVRNRAVAAGQKVAEKVKARK